MSPCTTRIGSTRMSLASLSIFFLKVALKSNAEETQENKEFHILILTPSDYVTFLLDNTCYYRLLTTVLHRLLLRLL